VSETDPKDGGEQKPPPAVDPPTASKPLDKPPARRIEDILAKPKTKSPVEMGYPGSPPPWWKTLREDPPYYLRLAIGGAFIALIVLLWWLVTRGSDPVFPATIRGCSNVTSTST
jgi:hypothetical protein